MTTTSRILDLDTSFLESDSEEDEEDLLKTYSGHPVFPKKTPPPQAGGRKRRSFLRKDQERPPLLSLTQSTEATSSCEEDPSSPRNERILRPEQVESKAQAAVRDLKLGELRDVRNLADVGWRKTTKQQGVFHKKGTVYWYPCVRLSKDRASSMLATTSNKRPKRASHQQKIGVQYLGWYFKDAWAWEEVAASTFLPLDNEREDETRLQTFLDQQFGSPPFKGSQEALERRTEELVIRACWQRVGQQQQDAKAKVFQENEQEGCIIDEDIHHNNHNNNHNKNTLLTEDRARNARGSERSNQKDTKDNDGDSSSDEMMGVGFQQELLSSPGGKRKRLVLKPGDIIVYYDPIGIFGDQRWYKETRILGIDPKQKPFPLNLANGENLPKDQLIRRVQKMHRGTLVEETEATGFRSMADFALRKSGTMEKIGFQQEVARIKQIREQHRQAMDDFWAQPQPNCPSSSSS